MLHFCNSEHDAGRGKWLMLMMLAGFRLLVASTSACFLQRQAADAYDAGFGLLLATASG